MGHDYLFAAPSFLSGVARTLDVAGSFDDYNSSPLPAIADARAAWLDWLAVGSSVRAAMRVVRREQTQAHADPT